MVGEIRDRETSEIAMSAAVTGHLDEVVRGASTSRLRHLAREAGMNTLAQDALRKVAEKLTTPHEMARVLQTEPGSALPCPGCGGPCPPEAVGCPWCGRPRTQRCRCGVSLEPLWRFCPACLRKA